MDLKAYLRWRTLNLRKEDGILVGADITQEWILPWWWEHYQKHATHPVAFVDLGLSFPMKEWCRERGELICLRVVDDFVKEKEEVDPQVAKALEEDVGKQFWDCRKAWFKKPLACLQSPFRRTVWIDVDCEIRGKFQKLFDYAEKAPGIALAKDQCDSAEHYPIYNSGVIVFRRDIELIVKWARRSLELNHAFRGDQEVLSKMIAEENIAISEIPLIYNWSRCQKDHTPALLLHWHGVYGKFVIRSQMNIK